jgi:hypothetical protein
VLVIAVFTADNLCLWGMYLRAERRSDATRTLARGPKDLRSTEYYAECTVSHSRREWDQAYRHCPAHE